MPWRLPFLHVRGLLVSAVDVTCARLSALAKAARALSSRTPYGLQSLQLSAGVSFCFAKMCTRCACDPMVLTKQDGRANYPRKGGHAHSLENNKYRGKTHRSSPLGPWHQCDSFLHPGACQKGHRAPEVRLHTPALKKKYSMRSSSWSIQPAAFSTRVSQSRTLVVNRTELQLKCFKLSASARIGFRGDLLCSHRLEFIANSFTWLYHPRC